MRIYISGKITGTTDYMERFAEVEERLTKQGHEVINPAKVCATLPITLGYESVMNICFALLDVCDVIYMMHGWEHSEGAARELARAREIAKAKARGKMAYYEDSPYSDKMLEKYGAITNEESYWCSRHGCEKCCIKTNCSLYQPLRARLLDQSHF